MKYETVYKRDLKWIFIYPRFTPDSPEEDKAAKRLNVFFEKIKEYITEYTSCEKFPEGGKYTAECTCDCEITEIKCLFSLRQRGRRLKHSQIVYKVEKGYIIKSNII